MKIRCAYIPTSSCKRISNRTLEPFGVSTLGKDRAGPQAWRTGGDPHGLICRISATENLLRIGHGVLSNSVKVGARSSKPFPQNEENSAAEDPLEPIAAAKCLLSNP